MFVLLACDLWSVAARSGQLAKRGGWEMDVRQMWLGGWIVPRYIGMVPIGRAMYWDHAMGNDKK